MITDPALGARPSFKKFLEAIVVAVVKDTMMFLCVAFAATAVACAYLGEWGNVTDGVALTALSALFFVRLPARWKRSKMA
ncbi:MAG: hypothetical protein M3081_10890 [Gemmatimonadota bacterium]|nr:hypothetical protein [Gemmatimonadota bacterium]